MGTPVSLAASFTDPGANDTHTCSVAWDDGTEETYQPGSGDNCDRLHTFTRPGMFTIDAKVTDDDGGVGSGTVMVIVYDPDGGFETVGLQLESPPGALAGEPPAAGPAHSEFKVRYCPGESGPTSSGGKVSFRFDGHFDLDSTSLEWLVVTPDDKVATKGVATVASTGTLLGPNTTWATPALAATAVNAVYPQPARSIHRPAPTLPSRVAPSPMLLGHGGWPMLIWVLVWYACFSAVLAWRLVSVVVTSRDAEHRRSAIAALAMVWGSGSVGAGALAMTVKLHELGVL